MAGLTTTTATRADTQATTQSPQAAPRSETGNDASGVQPGTAQDLLSSPHDNATGVPLTGTALTTIGLSKTVTGHSEVTPPQVHHHLNPALFGISFLLLAAAVVLFWLTSRSEKNTTK